MSAIGYDKIIGLVQTEKTSKQLADGKYVMKVTKNCNKNDIKSLVKNAFGVDVTKVNVSNVTGKTKRFKGVSGQRSSYKKVIFTIKDGQSINFQDLKA